VKTKRSNQVWRTDAVFLLVKNRPGITWYRFWTIAALARGTLSWIAGPKSKKGPRPDGNGI